MNSLKKIKAEKITVTLTLGEVDALVRMGRMFLPQATQLLAKYECEAIVRSLQKLDEAVNV
jgi:hypothetical protein